MVVEQMENLIRVIGKKRTNESSKTYLQDLNCKIHGKGLRSDKQWQKVGSVNMKIDQ